MAAGINLNPPDHMEYLLAAGNRPRYSEQVNANIYTSLDAFQSFMFLMGDTAAHDRYCTTAP